MRNRRPDVGQVPSPCVLICRIEDGECVGCKRTIDEIRDWIIMSEYEQNKLLRELDWRKNVRDHKP
jgi:predicted Fe-S protein YdhL (DUF1289 family)